jgi:hypothetical protein
MPDADAILSLRADGTSSALRAPPVCPLTTD